MRRSPGFYLIAVISLTVALGLSTTVFAHVDALTHPFVPVRNVQSLFRIAISGTGAVDEATGDEIAQRMIAVQSLDGVAMGSDSHGLLSAGEKGGTVNGYAVPPEYFRTLGVTPRLGRLFTPEESEESGVAIVSDAVWRSLFGNRREIGRATVAYAGRDYDVVGVLPQGLDKVDPVDIWLPRPRHYSRYASFLARANPVLQRREFKRT